jgi:hypothetical protein
LAGTRLSEQPIQRYSGLCALDKRSKNSGSSCVMLSAHFVLFSNSVCNLCISSQSKKWDQWAMIVIDRGDVDHSMAAKLCTIISRTRRCRLDRNDPQNVRSTPYGCNQAIRRNRADWQPAVLIPLFSGVELR